MKMTTLFTKAAVRFALLALCLGIVGAASVHAQDAPAAQGAPRGGPEMQQRQLDRLTRELALTPDQVTQIKAIQDDGMKQQMAMRDDTSTTGPDKRAKMMAMREAQQTKIKAVLTDDQKVKYDAMMEKMKERRQQPAGATPPPPPSL